MKLQDAACLLVIKLPGRFQGSLGKVMVLEESRCRHGNWIRETLSKTAEGLYRDVSLTSQMSAFSCSRTEEAPNSCQSDSSIGLRFPRDTARYWAVAGISSVGNV